MSFCINADKSAWVDRIYANNSFFRTVVRIHKNGGIRLLKYLEKRIFKRTVDLRTYLHIFHFSENFRIFSEMLWKMLYWLWSVIKNLTENKNVIHVLVLFSFFVFPTLSSTKFEKRTSTWITNFEFFSHKTDKTKIGIVSMML